MKKILLFALATGSIAGLQAQTVTDSLTYNGALQTYTVPCGVTSVLIECYGAAGASGADGSAANTGGAQGLGGYSAGTLAVTPGDILYVTVGGAASGSTGGFNGGANGGSQNAGGGGGASDVRVGNTALTDRVITAGGGGGGGRGGCETGSINGGNGGDGGGGNGGDGTNSPDGGGGFGAVGASAGAQGIGCSGFVGSPGTAGASGVGGVGGAGQSCCCFSISAIPGGGGGGGGFTGGGGGGGGSAGTTSCSGNNKGGGGGGAGGSSDISGVTSGTIVNGIRQGNGVVKITYVNPVPGMLTVSGSTTFCDNTTTTLTSNIDPLATGYTWTVPAGLTLLSGQNTTSITIAATAVGTFTVDVYANGACTNGPVTSVPVTVNAAPTVSFTTSPATTVCEGTSVTLTGAGATTLTWDNGVTDNVPFNATTTTTYMLIGSEANGCSDTASVMLTVNQRPTVGVTAAPSTTVCENVNVTLTGTGATNYSWSGGVNDGVPFPATMTNTYTVIGTDANGCSDTAMQTITVNPNPTVTASATPSTTICTGESVTLSGAGAVNYNWSNSVMNAVAFSPTSTNTYTVTGVDANGCTNSATITVTVNACVGIAENQLTPNLQLTPNPASDVLHVRWNAGYAASRIDIYDGNGKLVLSQAVSNQNADIDVTTLSNGVYSMKLTGANGQVTDTRFIKN